MYMKLNMHNIPPWQQKKPTPLNLQELNTHIEIMEQ